MSNDGTRLSRVFVYRQDGDRLDVTTARHGELNVDGDERYLTLSQGFEVEGPLGNGRDYRLMRYASNDLRLRSEEHTSEHQSLMRISYAVFCLKKKMYTTHK